jgi:hypothetical protein
MPGQTSEPYVVDVRQIVSICVYHTLILAMLQNKNTFRVARNKPKTHTVGYRSRRLLDRQYYGQIICAAFKISVVSITILIRTPFGFNLFDIHDSVELE